MTNELFKKIIFGSEDEKKQIFDEFISENKGYLIDEYFHLLKDLRKNLEEQFEKNDCLIVFDKKYGVDEAEELNEQIEIDLDDYVDERFGELTESNIDSIISTKSSEILKKYSYELLNIIFIQKNFSILNKLTTEQSNIILDSDYLNDYEHLRNLSEEDFKNLIDIAVEKGSILSEKFCVNEKFLATLFLNYKPQYQVMMNRNKAFKHSLALDYAIKCYPEILEKIIELIENNMLDIEFCLNSSSILEYYLKNKDYEKMILFSDFAFEQETEEMKDSIDLILKMAEEDDDFFEELSYSPYTLEYYLKNKDYDKIKKFEEFSFSSDLKRKYFDAIFDSFKDDEEMFVSLFSNSKKAFKICLENEQYYDKIKLFNKDLFTEKIIKNHLKVLINIFDDNINFKNLFANNSYMLAYCLEHPEYQNKLNLFENTTIINTLLDIDDDLKVKNYFMKLIGAAPNLQPILDYVFTRLNINLSDVIQYGYNSQKYPNWKEKLFFIINLGGTELNNFINVSDYLIKNYYENSNDKKHYLQNIFEILSNYEKNKNVINDLLNNKQNLTDEDKKKLHFLFRTNIDIRINSIDEVENIVLNYKKKINENSHILEIKNTICQLLFGDTIASLLRNINSEKLKILKFNNRKDNDIILLIEQLNVCVSIIEDIKSCNDKEALREIIDNFDVKETINIFNILSKFSELERQMYELESEKLLTNLTNINDSAVKLNDKDGYFDFRNSQYVLYAHVKSGSETIEELCNGETNNGKHNFICVSPISHRGQRYYTGAKGKIIFAYNHIPEGNFICSSARNMGSNSKIKNGSMDVKLGYIEQLGILESSEARYGNNAEVLLFREGLKPCGIIITADREPQEPTLEELEIAHKYGLSIILTQKERETIDRPKPIETVKEKEFVDKEEISKNIEYLSNLKTSILHNVSQNPKHESKKYAIITDIHGMYEPTLACLEDMRRRGITEIYSLGDNIGVGPNPREVLELLKEYGVKSIKGNHELYVEASKKGKTIKEILPNHKSAHNERNQELVDWTAEQIDTLEEYPISIELKSSSGQKVTLIHSTDQSIYPEPLPNLNDSDLIIEGHKHFEGQKGNTHTLRAAGMGDHDKHAASYSILSEDEYGNFKLEKIELPFDYHNMLHDANESDMPNIIDFDKFQGIRR